MRTRRTLLLIVAGTTGLLAGCGGGDDQTDSPTPTDAATATESPTQSDGSLSVTAADVTAAPGEDAAVEVTAQQVAVLTYRIGDIPENWQVTHEEFDPEPTAVRESYPPELVWEPAVESTTGTLTVAVADDADPGEYDLPVEVRAEDGEENAVSTATITVEG